MVESYNGEYQGDIQQYEGQYQGNIQQYEGGYQEDYNGPQYVQGEYDDEGDYEHGGEYQEEVFEDSTGELQHRDTQDPSQAFNRAHDYEYYNKLIVSIAPMLGLTLFYSF